MTEGISDYLKRPSRYAMIEGVGEMGIAIVISGISAFGILHARAGEHSIWNWKPIMLIYGVVLLALVFLAQAMIKKRITYPRTGYLKHRHSRVKSVVAIVSAAMLGAICAVLISNFWKHSEHRQDLQLLLSGLIWCLLYAYATKMDQTWRWIVAVAMTFGPLGTDRIMSGDPGQWVSFIVIGICWLISGTITFWLYLRRTRPAQEAP